LVLFTFLLKLDYRSAGLKSNNNMINIVSINLQTGQRLDSNGLYYYNARYYDPLIGRFISADTILPDPVNVRTTDFGMSDEDKESMVESSNDCVEDYLNYSKESSVSCNR